MGLQSTHTVQKVIKICIEVTYILYTCYRQPGALVPLLWAKYNDKIDNIMGVDVDGGRMSI